MLQLPFHLFRFEIGLAKFQGFNARCRLFESIAFHSSQAHQIHDVSDAQHLCFGAGPEQHGLVHIITPG